MKFSGSWLHFCLRELKRSFNKDYRDRIFNIDSNPYQPFIYEYGEANPERIIYNIEIDVDTGFYAMMNYVLCQLTYAQKMGFAPVINISSKFPYYEKDGIDGTYNPWEYYFEQPLDIRVEDIKKSAHVVNMINVNLLKDDYGKYARDGYQYGEDVIMQLGKTYAKYVKLNQKTKDYINNSYSGMLGDKTLGVKIRMGAMMLKNKNHPKVPEMKEYINEIEKCFNAGKYDKIFLASDDNRAVDAMVKKFGDLVVYYDDIVRVEGAMNTYQKISNRKNNNYMCGLEVIRDVYTLGMCDGLVAGLSQVSMGARILKASQNEHFSDMIILDKGINASGLEAGGKKYTAIVEKEIKKGK